MAKKDLTLFEKKIGFSFRNKDLLQQALVHRSYLNENKHFQLDHNERLEFLGDAVLELSVTHYLYDHYNLPEGELTNLRAAVVRGEMLSKVAQEIDMEEFLLLSKGERKGSQKARQYILANAFEALIGALYLDQGYEVADAFIHRYIVSKLQEVQDKGLHIDAKSKFQELAQEKFKITPSYTVLEETGADHEKHFVVGVYLNGKEMGRGAGMSKQAAQQEAAMHALRQLGSV